MHWAKIIIFILDIQIVSKEIDKQNRLE